MFLAAGAHLDDAKNHHNVIEEHFFSIPLDNVCSYIKYTLYTITSFQVCIPGLHLSLGIFNRIWSLLGGALTELDLKLAKLKSNNTTPTGSSTYDHFSSLLKISLKELEVNTQRGYTTLIDEMVTHSTLTIPNAQTSSFVKNLRTSSASAHKMLNKMV